MAWLLIIPILILWARVSTMAADNRSLRELLQTLTAQVAALKAGVLKTDAADQEMPTQAAEATASLAPAESSPIPIPIPIPETAPEPVVFDWDIAMTDAREEPLAPPAPVFPHQPAASPDFIERAWMAANDWLLGGNTVVRVGLVLLFIGLAFLLHYASEQYSLRVEFRYVGVGLVALVLLALGGWLRRKKPAYALALQGAGIAVLYLTSFAAMRLHHLLPPVAVFGLLVVLTVCAAILAILQDAPGLASAAALGGFAAPILASAGHGEHVVLFSYFALLNTGILSIAWFKAWRPLNLIGFVGTFCIGLGWGLRFYTPERFASTEPFLILFFLMFVGISLLFARRKLLEVADAPVDVGRGEMLRWSMANTDYLDGTMMFGPPLIGFGLQCALVQHFEYGTAFSALGLGLFYLVLALLLRARPRVSLLKEVCLALAVVFGSLAIPLAFEARWTSAAWAVEGAGIYWLALRQQRWLARAFSLLLIAAAVIFWLPDLRVGTDTLLRASPLGAALLGAAILFCHHCLRGAPATRLADWDQPCLPVFAVSGLVFLYLIAPLCFQLESTVIVWALAGVATLFVGLILGSSAVLACAVGVQLLGGGLLVLGAHSPGTLPGAVLALAAMFSAWRLHTVTVRQTAFEPQRIAVIASPLLAWGVLWWVWAVVHRIDSLAWVQAQALDVNYLTLLALSLSGLLWMLLARVTQWQALALASLLPLAVALWMLVMHGLPLEWPVLLAWVVFFGVHFVQLRHLASLLPAVVQSWAHILGAWLLVGVLALAAHKVTADVIKAATVWCWLAWALVPGLYLWLASGERGQFWPLKAFLREYRINAALPVLLALLGWLWNANGLPGGALAPLPYVPLINPLEVGLLLVFLACWRWSWRRLSEVRWPEPGLSRRTANRLTAIAGGGLVLVFAMQVVCRAAYFWGGVPFNLHAMAASMAVQAGWSLVWTFFALALMIGGSRRGYRNVWIAGAALVAMVVLKLFFVELSGHGSLARIVSFIGVGVLLLIVGYFSPLPPREERQCNVLG